MRADNLYELPSELPIPRDDGACDHLLGMTIPSDISLPSTANRVVNLHDVTQRTTVIYCYPRTGVPNREPRGGIAKWNAIPGARGCTPQSCGFRDHFRELQSLGATVFGLSTQSTAYQQEMTERLHLPFEVLSDAKLEFTRAMNLPTFSFDCLTLIKRLTLIVERAQIVKVFYPAFPPQENAQQVVDWLSENGQIDD